MFAKTKSSVINVLREIEDFFVCTPSEERMEYNLMGPEFYEEARFRFRGRLAMWGGLIALTMVLSLWQVSLIIGSLAVLHIAYFMLEQEKSTRGYPYLEHTDGLAIILFPLMALLTCWIIGGFIYGLIMETAFTLGIVGLIIGFSILYYVYDQLKLLVKKLANRHGKGKGK